MPSLAQLEEFKSSFMTIGDEPQGAEDYFALPAGEPASPFPEGWGESQFPSPGLDMPGLDLDLFPNLDEGPADTGPDSSEEPAGGDGFDFDGGNFDFGDLLGGSQEPPGGDLPDIPGMEDALPPPGPDDFSGPASLDMPEPPDPSPGVESGGFPLTDPGSPGEGDFNLDAAAETAGGADTGLDLPEDLLSGFADDLESGGLPAEDAGADVQAAEEETPGIDMSQALDMGGEFPEGAEAGAFDPGDLGGENVTPDQTELGKLNGLEFPDFDAAGEETSADAGEDAGLDMGGETAEGDFTPGLNIPGLDAGSLDDFGSLDLGGENAEPSAVEEEDELADLSDFTGADLAQEPPEAPDSFDSFDLGGEETSSLDAPDFPAPAEEFGDFSLAGFDDKLASPGTTAVPRAGPAASKPSPEEEVVEEIRLSEEDYKSLQDTLSAYPLNLRIACEELIAEQAVAPNLMSALIKLLVRGAPAKETAALAGKILGRTIPIPRGYAKQTGVALEAEQASFSYIFIHSFLPVLRLVGAIALVAASLAYLAWRFVAIPLQAEGLYKQGYTMLRSGEYTRANDLFLQAFEKNRVKRWFYRYAEGFRDERQYIYAERKYDELLRVYPRDKKGALDYAALETYYLKNFEKADRIIRNNILDYAINDREGLTALAENNLAWGETDPSRYEEARAAYARLMEIYGRQDPFLEGMLKYFIRTDKLSEVLPLQAYFMGNQKKRKIAVPTLAELGGYLLDKRFEETDGVPDEYADKIEGIRGVLLRAINADESYPESYYHLARYYNHYGSPMEERQSLERAIKIFDNAREENSRRAGYRVDAHRRYAEALISVREFFPAEEELIRGLRMYEDARSRQVLKTSPLFGRLYADLGDLEFFVKDGDMAAALRFYEEGERNGWAPPEIQYRMGAAHYQLEQWEEALRRFFAISPSMPVNKRLLYALGNVSYLRGNYFAAQGYYNRLMDILESERVRFPSLAPGSGPEEQDLAERIMVADNNLGVTLEALTRISGDTSYRSRALGLFSESIRAWDVLTRNPESMARMRPFRDLYGPGINLAYLNAQNILHPEPDYDQQIFMRIDRDALEPSPWELLIPRDYQLSEQLAPMAVE
ncbi:MAG: tetratricopeptide repeat protein [Treponema sp.]|jgi:tetratricopeptide (TPR) repeat protein|nr:tetratricopeptide repeat protein [Treponema sp.]